MAFPASFDHLVGAREQGWRNGEPSAFAVLRLMTISYFVGACTGRSAGFSPLRMRSTYPAARRYGSIVSAPYACRPPSGQRNSTDRSQEACAAPRSQSAGDERWPIHCPSRSGHDRRSTRIRQRSEEFCNTFPQRADIVGATSGHSHGPPAGYGTTIVIGRDG